MLQVQATSGSGYQSNIRTVIIESNTSNQNDSNIDKNLPKNLTTSFKVKGEESYENSNKSNAA